MIYFQPRLSDLADVIKFNEKAFYYGKYSKSYIEYRFIKNPFCEYPLDTIYSVKDETKNKYVGQMMTIPGKLVYKNIESKIYWGVDYIIDESYRGSGIGKELTKHFFSKDYYIAVGFTKKSEIIHKKMGCRAIGFLNYYYKPSSYFYYLKFVFHRLFKLKNKNLNDYNFPENVLIHHLNFKLIKSSKDFINPKIQWNENIVEPIRSKEFIEWRFFHKPNLYFLYQDQSYSNLKNPAYMVLRTTFWKGVNCLRIVDMRYDINSNNDFLNLIEAAKKIARQLNLFAILIASSLNKSNNLLKKQGYKLLSEKVILTKFPFDFNEAKSHSNDNILLNYADSDQEFFAGSGKFVYDKDF